MTEIEIEMDEVDIEVFFLREEAVPHAKNYLVRINGVPTFFPGKSPLRI